MKVPPTATAATTTAGTPGRATGASTPAAMTVWASRGEGEESGERGGHAPDARYAGSPSAASGANACVRRSVVRSPRG